MNSVDLIRRLMCNFQEPDAGEWRVYYVKQIHPEWGVRELSEFLNAGKSTVHRALIRFKMTSRNLQFFPHDNLRKVLRILESEPVSEHLWTFIRGLNYCPLFPHHEDAEFLMEILPGIENHLLPEVIVYLYSLILEQPERFDRYYNAATFERLMALRETFLLKGMMYSYYLSTIPHLIASIHFSYPISLHEYEYIRENIHRFPPFYRNLLFRYRNLLNMAMKGTSFHIPEIQPDEPFLRFLLQTTKGNYEKALQIDVDIHELSEEDRQWYQVQKTIIEMFLSPALPPPPRDDFHPTSKFIAMQMIQSKLIYARLTRTDPMQLLESNPAFHLNRYYIEKTYMERDPAVLEMEGEYPGKEILFHLLHGRPDEAWKAARNLGSIYDFHSQYIAMGYPLIDLMMKYNLRIRWIKPVIEIHPGRLVIRYAGDTRTIRGNTADILRDIVNGTGYLGKDDVKKLYRLRFLNFKKKRYSGGKIFVKLEDDAVVHISGRTW